MIPRPPLTQTREEILEKYPDAVWFPWDDIPIGTQVRCVNDAESSKKIKGKIVGRATDYGFTDLSWKGWWVVESSTMFVNEHGCYTKREEGDRTRPMRMVEWAPTLLPIDPTKVFAGKINETNQATQEIFETLKLLKKAFHSLGEAIIKWFQNLDEETRNALFDESGTPEKIRDGVEKHLSTIVEPSTKET
jgi:hypothetical protein